MEKVKFMDPDETWINRSVQEMVSDEFLFYNEVFKFILEDLEEKIKDKMILVEGTAILPQLIKSEGISFDNYLCIIPTKDFRKKQSY